MFSCLVVMAQCFFVLRRSRYKEKVHFLLVDLRENPETRSTRRKFDVQGESLTEMEKVRQACRKFDRLGFQIDPEALLFLRKISI